MISQICIYIYIYIYLYKKNRNLFLWTNKKEWKHYRGKKDVWCWKTFKQRRRHDCFVYQHICYEFAYTIISVGFVKAYFSFYKHNEFIKYLIVIGFDRKLYPVFEIYSVSLNVNITICIILRLYSIAFKHKLKYK